MKPFIGISAATLTGLYRTLSLIRRVELKIEELYPQDEMKTPVHLSLGQEAVSAGVCAHLAREDYAFSNHRSHAHYYQAKVVIHHVRRNKNQ